MVFGHGMLNDKVCMEFCIMCNSTCFRAYIHTEIVQAFCITQQQNGCEPNRSCASRQIVFKKKRFKTLNIWDVGLLERKKKVNRKFFFITVPKTK